MSLDNKVEVVEASRQLKALELAVHEVLKEAKSGRMDTMMATVKGEILTSLWRDGHATLLRLEAHTGLNPRRRAFSEAYATAKCALLKLRELPKYNGSPSEWPAFAERFEKRVAGMTEDADRYTFLLKCFERCDIARNSCETFRIDGIPFQRAWRKLEELFLKKRVAFLGHFEKILDLPKQTTTSANGLMHIINVVETSIASASQIAGKVCSKPTAIEDGLLVSIVLNKLNVDTLERISRRFDVQRIPTWRELRDDLDELINTIDTEPKRKEGSRAVPALLVVPPRSRSVPRRSCSVPLRSCSVPIRSCSVPIRPGSVPTELTAPLELSSLDTYVLIPTVTVHIQDIKGVWQKMRCMLDTGSQIEAITSKAAKRLRLTQHPGRLTVNGISGNLRVSRVIYAKVMATNADYRFNASFYVVPKLNAQPSQGINQIPTGMPRSELLADVSYGIPGPIDAILGAGIYLDSISEGLHRLPNGLTLQNSKFGWLIGGLLRDVTFGN